MNQLKWRKNLSYDPAHPECVLDICEPEGVSKPSLFIFFHGGGLHTGTQDIYPALASLAQERGIAVASAAYRMYPTARYPEFVVDAANAIAWLVREERITERFDKIVVGGSSAGAYLSMMLFFAKHFLKEAGVDERILSGWIFNSGQPMSHLRVLEEYGMDYRCLRVDEFAPMYYINESFQGKHTVPLLILAADHDMVNRAEQNVVLCTGLKHFDYPADQVEFRLMEGYTHCQYDEAQDENGRYVFADIIADFFAKL